MHRQRLKRIALWAGGSLIVIFLLIRIVNPPVTPLMVIRKVQNLFSGEHGTIQQQWMPLERIPEHVQAAVVAAEDARFMKHWGVDVGALLTAIRQSGSTRPLRGASTITMQTTKNVFLWPGRSYLRKILELPLAVAAELLWGKRRILELYMNVAEWGPGIYGIESAARHYYRRPAAQLSAAQAAALASILPNPLKLSPMSPSLAARLRLRRILRELHIVELPSAR